MKCWIFHFSEPSPILCIIHFLNFISKKLSHFYFEFFIINEIFHLFTHLYLFILYIRRCLLLGREAMTDLENTFKKQRHHVVDRGLYNQSYGFSSSHVWMWDLDHKEGSTLKNWCFWTVVLEKTLESPLDCKIKLVHPKGYQFWIFIGRTDAETEAPII